MKKRNGLHDHRKSAKNLEKLVAAVGKDHIVLDLSAKKHHKNYYVVTNRWQTFTKEVVDKELLEKLSVYCDEFLVHAVDVEGKSEGVDEELIGILSEYEGNPITYAGGIAEYDDIDTILEASNGRIHITIGSALDLFGGDLNYETVKQMCQPAV